MSLGIAASSTTPIGRFRIVAFWEGISYLVLLLVAMPLKYGLGFDIAVRVVGMLHGVLFIAYLITLALAARSLGAKWVVLALIMSIVPGGTFWLESKLRPLEEASRR